MKWVFALQGIPSLEPS